MSQIEPFPTGQTAVVDLTALGGDEPSDGSERVCDEDLLERSRQGDRPAYGELWSRYNRLALSVASPLAFSETEDIVSDSFAAIWSQLQSGRGPRENFRAYLLATVRNLAARSHRRTARVLTGVERDEELVEDETAAIEHEEEVRHVMQAFQQLPPRWRQVLWLSEVESLNRGQIAEQMSLTPNTATQLLRRAKEALRTAWLCERTADAGEHPQECVIAELPRYVRGTLPRTKKERVLAHLTVCVECEERASELRRENLVLAGSLALIPLVGGVLSQTGGSGVGVTLSNGASAWLQHRFAEVMYTMQMRPGVSMLTTAVPVGVALFAAGSVVIWGALSAPPETDSGAPAPTETQSSEAAAEAKTSEVEAQPSTEPERPVQADDRDEPNAPTDQVVQPVVDTPDIPDPETNPEPLPDPVPAARAPTMALQAPSAGVFAPVVLGEAEPGVPIELEVSGAEYSLPVDATGAWMFDLSQVPLYAGMHSIRARQAYPDRDLSAPTVNFELRIPTASVVRTGVGVELSINGAPGYSVCVVSGAAGTPRVDLDGNGWGSAALSGIAAGTALEFAYCDGQRIGASGVVRAP